MRSINEVNLLKSSILFLLQLSLWMSLIFMALRASKRKLSVKAVEARLSVVCIGEEGEVLPFLQLRILAAYMCILSHQDILILLMCSLFFSASTPPHKPAGDALLSLEVFLESF
jgi:hypothetical protein